jgi:hypothetical protein
MTTPTPSESVDRQAALQLHISEYQALTNRSTYYTVIGSTIWPALILFWAIIIPLWNSEHAPYLLWVTCSVVEFALLLWAENVWEQYRNIFYIEHNLKPLIASLLPLGTFWDYERFLDGTRKRRPLWREAYVGWASICVLASISSYRVSTVIGQRLPRSHWWEVFAFTLNLGLVVSVIRKERILIKLRQSFFHSPLEPGSRITAT